MKGWEFVLVDGQFGQKPDDFREIGSEIQTFFLYGQKKLIVFPLEKTDIILPLPYIGGDLLLTGRVL